MFNATLPLIFKPSSHFQVVDYFRLWLLYELTFSEGAAQPLPPKMSEAELPQLMEADLKDDDLSAGALSAGAHSDNERAVENDFGESSVNGVGGTNTITSSVSQGEDWKEEGDEQSGTDQSTGERVVGDGAAAGSELGVKSETEAEKPESGREDQDVSERVKEGTMGEDVIEVDVREVDVGEVDVREEEVGEEEVGEEEVGEEDVREECVREEDVGEDKEVGNEGQVNFPETEEYGEVEIGLDGTETDLSGSKMQKGDFATSKEEDRDDIEEEREEDVYRDQSVPVIDESSIEGGGVRESGKHWEVRRKEEEKGKKQGGEEEINTSRPSIPLQGPPQPSFSSTRHPIQLSQPQQQQLHTESSPQLSTETERSEPSLREESTPISRVSSSSPGTSGRSTCVSPTSVIEKDGRRTAVLKTPTQLQQKLTGSDGEKDVRTRQSGSGIKKRMMPMSPPPPLPNSADRGRPPPVTRFGDSASPITVLRRNTGPKPAPPPRRKTLMMAHKDGSGSLSHVMQRGESIGSHYDTTDDESEGSVHLRGRDGDSSAGGYSSDVPVGLGASVEVSTSRKGRKFPPSNPTPFPGVVSSSNDNSRSRTSVYTPQRVELDGQGGYSSEVSFAYYSRKSNLSGAGGSSGASQARANLAGARETYQCWVWIKRNIPDEKPFKGRSWGDLEIQAALK